MSHFYPAQLASVFWLIARAKRHLEHALVRPQFLLYPNHADNGNSEVRAISSSFLA